MKRLYFLTLVFLAGATSAYSQATSCAQVLRLVRTTYEQGRLHELPDLMGACLNGVGDKGFTKDEKREALRYLTLAYIYLEEPEQADASMLKLLETDHFYTINEAVDPAEFIALYRKYRTDALFRIGVKLGPNYFMPALLNNYYVGSASAGHGSYSPGIGFQLGVAFEKDLTGKFKKFSLAPEVMIINGRNFTYNNPQLTTKDSDPTASSSSLTATISQSWIDLNAIVQYKLKNNKYNFYAGLGPAINYLVGSKNQLNTTLGNGFTVTGQAVDDSKSFKPLNYSVIALVGSRLRVGEIYVTGEIRYQYGINSVIDPNTRSNPETLHDYGFLYDDYRMNTITATVGILYPYFKPKKLIK